MKKTMIGATLVFLGSAPLVPAFGNVVQPAEASNAPAETAPVSTDAPTGPKLVVSSPAPAPVPTATPAPASNAGGSALLRAQPIAAPAVLPPVVIVPVSESPQQTPPANPAKQEPITVYLPMQTTTARVKRQVSQAPYRLHIIRGDEMINEDQSRTLPEALREIPGVSVQKTSRAQGSPFIRGFTGFRTLFLVDGVRLNNSVFRDGPNQYSSTVDLFSLSSLEVLKGPSSALYGSDAVGGAVNAIVKSDADFDSKQPVRLQYRYAEADQSHVGRIETGTRIGDNLGLYLGVSTKTYGELDAGGDEGRLPKTDYSELGSDLKLRFRLSESSDITALYQRYQIDDAWRTHSTIFAKSYAGTAVGTDKERILDQNRELSYVRYSATHASGGIDRVQATFSYHRQWEDEHRVKSNSTVSDVGFDVGTTGFNLVMESATSPRNLWTYGADFYRDNVKADPVLRGPVANDSVYDLLSVFVQHERALSSRLSLISGAHYTYAKADAPKVGLNSGGEISINETWTAPVFSLRSLYALNDDKTSVMFLGASEAFRAPNLSDLTRFDIARSNEIETPSIGLSPEKFVSYEIGHRLATDHLKSEISYFYTTIEDMIIRQPTGGAIGGKDEVIKRNSGNGYVQGLEFEGEAPLSHSGRWTGRAHFTVQEGFVDGYPTSSSEKRREWMSRLAPTMLGLTAIHKQSEKWKIEVGMVTAEKQDRLSAADVRDDQRIPPGGTPGYTVWSLRSIWAPEANTQVVLGVENISDVAYRIHGSGLNEPGRNFMLNYSHRF